jgi:predicted amidohydrolase
MPQLRLGVVQVQPGALERVPELVGRSEPDLLLLPEYSTFDPTGLPADEVWRRATTVEDFAERLARLASERGAHVAGGFLERGPRPRVYSTAIVVAPDGRVVGAYRKTHLFDAYGFRESEFAEPGSELSQVLDIRGVRVALAVCFELRFPEVFRELALAGAELAAVPAAWYAGPLKEEALRVLARARAVENGMFVAVSALYSQRFTGRSLVVDPLGVVVADLGVGERYAEVLVDTSMVSEARRLVPSLQLRRPELYRRLCGDGRRG